MKKVLLTGSEGFVGLELQTYIHLNSLPYQIQCVDRKLGLEVNKVEDLSDVQAVIHLAAQPNVFNSNLYQIKEDNIEVFEYICDLAKKFNVPFIYASSATAYDKNISSYYGESKKANELYATLNYPKSIGLRFHNIYSRSPRKDTIFYNLLNKGSVSLVSNGKTTRHFTYITDILDSILSALDNYEELNSGIYNVLNPVNNTTLELAKEVQKYRPELEIKLIDDIEGRDTIFQYVDESLPTIPLKYKTIQEGIHDIFRTHLLDKTSR